MVNNNVRAENSAYLLKSLQRAFTKLVNATFKNTFSLRWLNPDLNVSVYSTLSG